MKAIAHLLAAALLLLPLTLSAAEATPRRIVVTGEGSAEAAPDMATLNLTVSRDAPTAREAVTANSRAMQDVIEAMRSLGIAERDLQTAAFDIQPVYDHVRKDGVQERRIAAYRVRNSLSVRVRDIGRVGEVLDRSVSLGVNEGGGISFGNSEPEPIIEKARRRAVQDAAARARTLAEEAGVELGEVVEISEHGFRGGPMPMLRASMMAAADAESVPVATGENSYSVQVNMSFAID